MKEELLQARGIERSDWSSASESSDLIGRAVSVSALWALSAIRSRTCAKAEITTSLHAPRLAVLAHLGELHRNVEDLALELLDLAFHVVHALVEVIVFVVLGGALARAHATLAQVAPQALEARHPPPPRLPMHAKA